MSPGRMCFSKGFQEFSRSDRTCNWSATVIPQIRYIRLKVVLIFIPERESPKSLTTSFTCPMQCLV